MDYCVKKRYLSRAIRYIFLKLHSLKTQEAIYIGKKGIL